MRFVPLLALGLLACRRQDVVVQALLYPHDVQGPGFVSLKLGQQVQDVQGVLMAKDANGCFLQTPDDQVDDDDRTSEGLYVFRSAACNFTEGDLVQVSGRVAEYSSGGANSLRLTELTSTKNVSRIQAGRNSASPVVVGGRRATSKGGKKNRVPPTKFVGTKDPFALPDSTTTLESGARNASLGVKTYGADFWESLESTLVVIQQPTVLGPVSRFGEFYILPNGVPTTSMNSRGGLTLAARDGTSSAEDRWDANPQGINLVAPLDGTKNDATLKLGDVLEDVTGVIGYDFGLYTFAPLTAPKIKRRKRGSVERAPWTSSGRCNNILTGTYNVENLMPTDTDRISKLGGHIDTYLRNPDVLVLNEIQDNSGNTDDGTVGANKTLDVVLASIKGAKYSYADVDPINDQDGGEPGGNIRSALIWRPDRLELRSGIPAGNSTQPVDVVSVNGKAQLTLNPGRIDPADSAWKDSRKPIVGQFDLVGRDSQSSLFVIGVHFTSKGGSTTPYQNPQAPVNGGVAQRIAQANEVRSFVEKILQIQPDAHVAVLGDFNEFSSVQPLDTLTSSAALQEVKVAKRVERYSYIFQQNCQELDHVFVSPAVHRRSPPKIFVPHVNTWAATADQVSDHDPVVVRLNVC